MTKKPKSPPRLGFADIVLGADTETIRQALEARAQIDKLLAERAEAYERIAALENQVDEILGDEAAFPFPDPPQPVFGFGPATAKKKPAKKAAKAAAPTPKPPVKADAPAGDDPEA